MYSAFQANTAMRRCSTLFLIDWSIRGIPGSKPGTLLPGYYPCQESNFPGTTGLFLFQPFQQR